MNIFKKAVFTGLFVIIILVVAIAAGELICRGTDWLFSSITRLDYLDAFNPGHKLGRLLFGGCLKENFDHFVIGGYGKPVKFKTNSMGFRYDKDVPLTPGAGTVRVLSLGDSFTTGYRIDQEQTFSRLLEKYLNAKKDGSKYEVLISCILYPRVGLDYLSNFGIRLKPKAVILGITLGNDILESSQIDFSANNKSIPESCLTGNPIEGQPQGNSLIDKSVLYQKIKSLSEKYKGEAIVAYGRYYPPALYDLCNGLSFYLNNPPEEINAAYVTLFDQLLGYKKLSEEYGFKFIVVLFPQRFQVQEEDWAQTLRYYGLKEACFSLNRPNQLIMDFCKKENIACIDPTEGMSVYYKAKRKNLYFPLGDMHWNALGNKAISDAIKARVYDIIRERR